MSDTIKTCGCSRSFDVAAWRELPGCGRMADGDGGELDLRNCPCHSTLAVPVADLEEDDRLAFELNRLAKIKRLQEAAEIASALAVRFSDEDRAVGFDPAEDHRVLSVIRQVDEYFRAIARLHRMTFNEGDLVLAATMSEELRSAAE